MYIIQKGHILPVIVKIPCIVYEQQEGEQVGKNVIQHTVPKQMETPMIEVRQSPPKN